MDRRTFLAIAACVPAIKFELVPVRLPVREETWFLHVAQYANEYSLLERLREPLNGGQHYLFDLSCSGISEFVKAFLQCELVRRRVIVEDNGLGWAIFDLLKADPKITDRVFSAQYIKEVE